MEHTVKIMKALSDRNRLRIIFALQETEELCACQITELIAVSGATISKHLGVLQRAEVVDSRKEGKWTFYTLQSNAVYEPLIVWLRSQLLSSETLIEDRKELHKILSVSPEEICRKQRGEDCCPTRNT